MKEHGIFNYFRGEEYPLHFKFTAGDGDLHEGEVVGVAKYPVPEKHVPDELLVWSQGGVIGMTLDRYLSTFGYRKP